MEPPAVNVFEPPDSADDVDAIRRQIAAHAVCEMKVTDIDDLDDIVERVIDALQNRPKDTVEILESRKSGMGLGRVPAAIQRILDESSGASPSPKLTKRFEIQDKPKQTRSVFVHATVAGADAEKYYKHFAFCGALWYSGLLSTILAVLGWSEVNAKIKQIESGGLVDLNDRMKLVDSSPIGKSSASLRERKRSVLATLKSRKTSFGAAISPDAQKKFTDDQRARADATKKVDEDENEAGIGPSFLEAYIHEVAEAARATMEKEATDTAKFRLIAYASACVLYVLAVHHLSTCVPRTDSDITTGAELGKAIIALITNHTAVPNRNYGSFQWLVQFLNHTTTTGGVTFGKFEDATAGVAIEGDELVELAKRLATFEKTGEFAWLLKRPDDDTKAKAYVDVFDVLVPGYKPKVGANVTNAPRVAADAKINALKEILLALQKKKVEPSNDTKSDDTPMSKNGNIKDEFERALLAIAEAMVNTTWEGVQLTAEYKPIVERAKASVSTAKTFQLSGKRDEANAYLGEIVDKLPAKLAGFDAKTIDIRASHSLLIAACLALEPTATAPTISEITKKGATEIGNSAERSTRALVFHGLITDVLEKNGTSLTKFLAMVRQLTVKSEYKFEGEAARVALTAGAKTSAEIVTTSKATVRIPGSAEFEKLKKLAGVDYFNVPATEIGPVWIVLTKNTENLMRKTTDLVRHIYARLPSALVTKSDGNAILRLDALYAEKRRDPKVDITYKEASLNKQHAEATTLLDVGPETARAALAPKGREKLVYGIVFEDKSRSRTNVWRLFVHIAGDMSYTQVRTSSRLPLVELIEESYTYIHNKLGPASQGQLRVVYGEDEWRDAIRPVRIPEIAKLLLNAGAGTGNVQNATPVARRDVKAYVDDNVLVVHRWPELEFVPAPYALATPMFSARNPAKLNPWP
jgi:hypothetical protein